MAARSCRLAAAAQVAASALAIPLKQVALVVLLVARLPARAAVRLLPRLTLARPLRLDRPLLPLRAAAERAARLIMQAPARLVARARCPVVAAVAVVAEHLLAAQAARAAVAA